VTKLRNPFAVQIVFTGGRAEGSRSATVLLVDDEILVRFATAEMLRDAGYEVIEAASGPSARELVRAGLTPDILVSDQLMPGMKGNELAAELGEALPGLRVLLATGYTDLPDLNLPRISKPFGAAELVERVRALIEEA
jgi:CheY-like chemotaxis protein